MRCTCRSDWGPGICGAIFARDLLGLRTEIIGVQSTGADCYAQSLAAGHVVVLNRSDTLADGMAVRQPDPEAFEIIRRGVSRIVCVSDAEVGSGDPGVLDRYAQSGRGRRRGAAGGVATGTGAMAGNGSGWWSAAAISIWSCFGGGWWIEWCPCADGTPDIVMARRLHALAHRSYVAQGIRRGHSRRTGPPS